MNALYLICEGFTLGCDRLNYELNYCPTCGHGIKFSRSIQWIDWLKFAGHHENQCYEKYWCPVCKPRPQDQKYALMWVGKRYYTVSSFTLEAEEHGVCKRIPQIPKNLEIGKTWILFAHPEAFPKTILTDQTNLNGKKVLETVYCPGIFYCARATRIEQIVPKETSEEEIKKLQKRGITVLKATKIDDEGNVLETELIERGNNE